MDWIYLALDLLHRRYFILTVFKFLVLAQESFNFIMQLTLPY
jgi:hypothetical protein